MKKILPLLLATSLSCSVFANIIPVAFTRYTSNWAKEHPDSPNTYLRLGLWEEECSKENADPSICALEADPEDVAQFQRAHDNESRLMKLYHEWIESHPEMVEQYKSNNYLISEGKWLVNEYFSEHPDEYNSDFTSETREAIIMGREEVYKDRLYEQYKIEHGQDDKFMFLSKEAWISKNKVAIDEQYRKYEEDWKESHPNELIPSNQWDSQFFSEQLHELDPQANAKEAARKQYDTGTYEEYTRYVIENYKKNPKDSVLSYDSWREEKLPEELRHKYYSGPKYTKVEEVRYNSEQRGEIVYLVTGAYTFYLSKEDIAELPVVPTVDTPTTPTVDEPTTPLQPIGDPGTINQPRPTEHPNPNELKKEPTVDEPHDLYDPNDPNDPRNLRTGPLIKTPEIPVTESEKRLLKLRSISNQGNSGSEQPSLTDQTREENLAHLKDISKGSISGTSYPKFTRTDPDAYQQYRLELLREIAGKGAADRPVYDDPLVRYVDCGTDGCLSNKFYDDLTVKQVRTPTSEVACGIDGCPGNKDSTVKEVSTLSTTEVACGIDGCPGDKDLTVKEVSTLSTSSTRQNQPSSFTQTISSGSTVAEPIGTTSAVSETVSTKTVEPKTTKKEKMKDRVRKIRMKKR